MVHLPEFPMVNIFSQAGDDKELTRKIEELKKASKSVAKQLEDRVVWMINSTASGGGVAEMMPSMLKMFEELGLDVRWAVIETEEAKFFDLTKRLHNAIHGECNQPFTRDDKLVYMEVNDENFFELEKHIHERDIVVVHDPQPLGLVEFIKHSIGCKVVWRSHIGLEKQNDATRAAWNFLDEFFGYVDLVAFTAKEYVPPQVSDKPTHIINPSIDPFATKNRILSNQELLDVLKQEDLTEKITKVGYDGEMVEEDAERFIGREIILQVSRWDKLKGWGPLLEAFQLACEKAPEEMSDVLLVLAGPDPASVADDPEGLLVWQEMVATYVGLSDKLKEQVTVMSLPVFSRAENHLIVNALQTVATFVVQNSIQEGWGLTITEALWKGKPVVGSTAFGCKQQIENEFNGLLTENPENSSEVCENLIKMLTLVRASSIYNENAKNSVYKNSLMFRQIQDYLNIFNRVLHI